MRKTDLNAIYISERVQETLRPVSVSALTAVVAPMGYGKTTAVNWFLNQRRQTEAAVILRVNWMKLFCAKSTVKSPITFCLFFLMRIRCIVHRMIFAIRMQKYGFLTR